MKRTVCLLLAVVMIAVLFAGCSSQKDESRKFVGKYSMSYHDVVLTVKSDKTYTYAFNGRTTETGTWTCSGDTVTFKGKDGSKTTGFLNGNTLVVGGKSFSKNR